MPAQPSNQQPPTLQPWRTLARRPVLQAGDGRFLTVEYHTVQLPNGQVIEEWPWLRTPDFVNIVVETAQGRFVCFRQTKYAAPRVTLAVAGGYIEPGEEPLAAAQRELLEETGYAAPDWTALGEFVVDGNRGAGRAYLFLARQAVPLQPIAADDLEEQELLLLTRQEMAHALVAGEFSVLPWAAAVALALLRLG
ncbi:MAG: NUDIX hydrolase [Caldilineaceae bacterium]|nr:NUDIX hydrolase [Caldilineaceae bacterium]